MPVKTGNKATYFDKLKGLLEEYKSIFLVNVDNVSSQQMHEIRVSIRGKGVILMGKNTMVRRAVKTFLNDLPDTAALLPHIKGNIGFVFTNIDLKDMREMILKNRVAAPARAGAVAPADVYVPAGNTGMEPGKTSFFQALGVPTKIARGTIEITSDVLVCQSGSRVGASEATLLNMLNISPFTYGMSISQIYDSGVCFQTSVLDIEEDQLLKAFHSAIATITNISLAITYPTLPSVIHSLLNSYKNLLAIAAATEYEWPAIKALKDRLQQGVFFEYVNKVLVAYKNMLAIGFETEYTWPLFDQVKDQILNPSAAPAAAAAPAASSAPADAAPAKEEKKEEEEDEDDADMGFGLFGDD